MTSAKEFGQLRLKFTDPVQHHYEVIRLIVLFSETISERSRQTGINGHKLAKKPNGSSSKVCLDWRTNGPAKQVGNRINILKRSPLKFFLSSNSIHPSIIGKLCGSLNANLGTRIEHDLYSFAFMH